MEPAKRVMLATKYQMESAVPINEVQAETLQIGSVDSTLEFLLETMDLQLTEEILSDPDVTVFNSKLNKADIMALLALCLHDQS